MTHLSFVLAFCILLAACDKPKATVSTPPPATTKVPKTRLKTNGTLLFANRSLKVAPFVSHVPGMDIHVRCREELEKATKAGRADVTLCYGASRRTKATTLRIEMHDHAGLEKARKHMAEHFEATHFLIRGSGSIYQLLDLAYDGKRDGQVRGGEIRVLSAHPEATESLKKALLTHMPHLKLVE